LRAVLDPNVIISALLSSAVRWLAQVARTEPDPSTPGPARSADPDDDYLIALAAEHRAALVSGDRHLLDLRGSIPAFSPAEFLALLRDGPQAS
jgi:predicted nucleic acid-binding protein